MIRRRRSTLQTVVKHPNSSHINPRSSNHDHFRPYRKLKHPTKTSRHSTTTTAITTGVLHQDLSYTLSVVWAPDHAGSVGVWDWTGVRVGGKARARARCDPEILELAWVGPEAGWGTRVGIVQRYVVVFSLTVGI